MKNVRIISALLVVISLIFATSCAFNVIPGSGSNMQNNDVTMATQNGMNAWLPDDMLATEPSSGTFVTQEQNSETQENSEPSESYESSPSVPEVTQAPSAAPPAVPDFSSYTKEQVLNIYAKALNLTRSYMGNVTVHHTESFDAEVKEATPDVALVKTLANYIVDLVGSEGEQDLYFSGGKTTNKDGETIPILLPQRTSFSLPAEGVSSATATQEGEYLHIKIVLVPETVAMGEVPKYNSTSIGYLDTSGMDFKIITISRVDISYTGSVIDAYIRQDGYVQSVTYTINMSTYAELSGMGITGSGTLQGAQTEKWQFLW